MSVGYSITLFISARILLSFQRLNGDDEEVLFTATDLVRLSGVLTPFHIALIVVFGLAYWPFVGGGQSLDPAQAQKRLQEAPIMTGRPGLLQDKAIVPVEVLDQAGVRQVNGQFEVNPLPLPTEPITPTITSSPVLTSTPVLTLSVTATPVLTTTPVVTATPVLTVSPGITTTPLTPTLTLTATPTSTVTPGLTTTPVLTATPVPSITVTPLSTIIATFELPAQTLTPEPPSPTTPQVTTEPDVSDSVEE